MSGDRLRVGPDGVTRCWWCGDDPLYVHYHDEEWGHPVTSDVRLFEKLCLEGFQAGLAWITILRKREHFRAAFAGFELQAVAAFDEGDVARLLADIAARSRAPSTTPAVRWCCATSSAPSSTTCRAFARPDPRG